MPCTADTVCDRLDDTNYSTNFAPDAATHLANMGWVGFLNLVIPSLKADNILRVTSADVNLSQDITKPDVIDGRIDKTVYQLGPKIVEGSLSMPIIADINPNDASLSAAGCPEANDLSSTTSVAGNLLKNIWCWATARGPQGRLLYNDAELRIRYANHAAFAFDTAIVNTLGMTVTQSDAVTFDIDVIGRARSTAEQAFNTDAFTEPKITDFLAPARVFTWNDVTVNGIGGCSNPEDLFFSNQVRAFTMEINNNADRFYTLNGSLFPVDINVGQREVTGSLTLLGLQDRLRLLAETNQDRFTEKNEIRFAFYIGEDTFNNTNFTPRDWIGDGAVDPPNAIFFKRLTSVVFQIEEIAMTNEVLETTINWHAFANDQLGYVSLSPSGSCDFPVWE